MVKINENEALLSKTDIHALIASAAALVIGEYVAAERESQFMEFAAEIAIKIIGHIWWDEAEKLPEQSLELVRLFIDAGTREAEEDRQAICRLLLAELQKAREFRNLADLRFIPDSTVELVFASGNKRQINVEADSGIAMARDILAHL